MLTGRENNSSDDMADVLAAQSDVQAFATLYLRYVTRIYHYVRAHGFDQEDSADLTQQIFVRALKAIATFSLQGSFSSWLFRIAHNVVVNARRDRHSNMSWDDLPESAHPVDADETEALVLQREQAQWLRGIIRQLPPEKQEILALRYAGGLSINEIALVLGKSPAAIKKQLSRLIQTLREHYHDAKQL